MNKLIVKLSHELMRFLIEKEDTVIDATMGNGHDTLFLSGLCDHVYAFDIQADALFETKQKLVEANRNNVDLILESHENILDYVIDFKGAIFNLGYLPGGDKSITTTAETTLKTFYKLLPYLRRNGFLLYVVYPGHEEGKKEADELHEAFYQLDSMRYKIVRIDLPYQHSNPPYILCLIKQKDED